MECHVQFQSVHGLMVLYEIKSSVYYKNVIIKDNKHAVDSIDTAADNHIYSVNLQNNILQFRIKFVKVGDYGKSNNRNRNFHNFKNKTFISCNKCNLMVYVHKMYNEKVTENMDECKNISAASAD